MQLSQQVALGVSDMATTEGEVQKGLAETAGIPVEALEVKAMHPMYGGMQMSIVNMPRMNALHIIKSEKVRIGWVIARVREKISVPRCFRCSTFGHLSHNCDKQCDKTVLSIRGRVSPCRDLQQRTGVHSVRGDGCRPQTSIWERKMHCPSEGEGKEAKKRKWLSFYK